MSKMTFERIDPGFSVAEASFPEIHFSANCLDVRFNDWRERPIHVVFGDVVAFCWDVENARTYDLGGESYLVNDSSWLERCKQQREAGHEHRHFKLCFNPYGELDVIATSPRRFGVGSKKGFVQEIRRDGETLEGTRRIVPWLAR